MPPVRWMLDVDMTSAPRRGDGAASGGKRKEPMYTLRDLVDSWETAGEASWAEPAVYGILFHTDAAGLDHVILNYVRKNWKSLNSTTGPNFDLFVLPPKSARQYRPLPPDKLNDVARHIGVPVDAFPALVVFVDPDSMRYRLIRMGDVFDNSETVTDEQLTKWFRRLATIADQVAGKSRDKRLGAISKALKKEIEPGTSWGDRIESAARTASNGKTIVEALKAIVLSIALLV